jgi:hypothetical protein
MFESKKDIISDIDRLRQDYYALANEIYKMDARLRDLANALGFKFCHSSTTQEHWEKKGQGCHT